MFIRKGRSTHAVRRVSVPRVHACATTLPSLDQMFFYLGDRPPSDWGQPRPPTPRSPRGCREVCQLSLTLTPVPGHWFWGKNSLGFRVGGPSQIWQYYWGKLLEMLLECVRWGMGSELERVEEQRKELGSREECRMF